MLIYIIASIFYLLATHIGTPFTDSLTAEQNEIKSKSSRTRSVFTSVY